MTQQQIPDWFNDAIVQGIQELYALSLPRTPAFKVVPATAIIWMKALTVRNEWDEKRDLPRLQAAFSILALDVAEWPGPKQLMACLPRAETKALGYEYTPVSKEQAQRRYDAVMAQFTAEEATTP